MLKEHQGSGRDDFPMGPVINQSAFNRISGYIETARKEGMIAFGGNYDDSKGFYIEPTVVRDITKDAVIAKEEIFGPVLAVIRANSFDEALEIANSTEYGLTGSVYTEDRTHIQKAKAEFHVGNLYLDVYKRQMPLFQQFRVSTIIKISCQHFFSFCHKNLLATFYSS